MTTLLASTIGDRQCVPMECVRRYRCEAAGSRSGSEVTRSQPVGATFSMRRESPEPTVDRRSIANFRYQLCRRWLRYCLGLMSRP
jgi:hypothetical protein